MVAEFLRIAFEGAVLFGVVVEIVREVRVILYGERWEGPARR